MSIFSRIFRRSPDRPTPRPSITYRMMEGYVPSFTSYQGALYEAQLVRSSVDAIARNISKLSIEITTTKQTKLINTLRHSPNKVQTWSQFLYRLATIMYLHNTAFIVPEFGDDGQIEGYYPILPTSCEVIPGQTVTYKAGVWSIEDSPAPWLRYRLRSGSSECVPMSLCAVLTRYQYRHDFFGEPNTPLRDTLDLIKYQNQAIEEAIKHSASYRFMAQMSNFSDPEDLKEERERFTRENLSADSDERGLLLFPNTYKDIKQINAGTQYVADAATMEYIRSSVYDYFGVNSDVLQNKLTGDSWSAFYEGCIEPFAIQLSETLTRALFSDREQTSGSALYATSNRLQYLTNGDKLKVSSNMLDRGVFTPNEIREIWNLPPLATGGDKPIIRGEYYIQDDDGNFIKSDLYEGGDSSNGNNG